MYADWLDDAAACEQLLIEVALANRQPPKPAAAICQNGDCGEPSHPGTRYCCSECREDDERHQWAQSQRPQQAED